MRDEGAARCGAGEGGSGWERVRVDAAGRIAARRLCALPLSASLSGRNQAPACRAALPLGPKEPRPRPPRRCESAPELSWLGLTSGPPKRWTCKQLQQLKEEMNCCGGWRIKVIVLWDINPRWFFWEFCFGCGSPLEKQNHQGCGALMLVLAFIWSRWKLDYITVWLSFSVLLNHLFIATSPCSDLCTTQNMIV